MKLRCSAIRRVLAALAIAGAATLVSACSAPGAFPNLFDDPAPRGDATLTPDQVKQAVDNLVSERDRLCSVAVANEPAGSPPPDCRSANATGTTPAAGAGAKP